MSKLSNNGEENIPLDEMLRRLKDGGDADGELVTREDGSQVRRVRRKRRRSHQPHKEAEKQRKKLFLIQFFITIGLIGIVVAIFGALFIRYNRLAFAKTTQEELAAETTLEAEISGMTVMPTSISVKTIKLRGDEADFISEITAKNTKANLDFVGFLTNELTGDTAYVEDILVSLKLPTKTKVEKQAQIEKRFLFDHYESGSMAAHFGNGSASSVKILDSHVLLYQKSDATELRLRGGTFRINGFDDFPIENATVEVKEGLVDLVALRLFTAKQQGSIEFSDSIDLRQGSENVLSGIFKDVPFDSVVSNGLGGILNGYFTSPAAVARFTLGGGEDVELTIPFSHGQVFLDRLPMLKVLSDTLDLDTTRPQFHTKMRGIIHRKGDETKIEDLSLQDSDRLIIHGELSTKAGGSLEGNLRLGVAERLMITQNGEFVHIGFSAPKNGYCWVDVKISGSVEKPLDDFRQTLKKAQNAVGTEGLGGFEAVFDKLIE